MRAVKERFITIDKYLPLYYAGASGDFNLIHIDPEFARGQGLESNILQGLCTLGIATGLLIGDRDPAILKSIKVRFANPVLPGDRLTFTIEETAGEVQFTAVNQGGVVVLENCSAELH
ncbi:MAG: MaoC family dehydratase [Fidelibacterota bacterium]